MDTDKITEQQQELETLLRQTQEQLTALRTQEQRVIGGLAVLQQMSEAKEEEKPPAKRAKK